MSNWVMPVWMQPLEKHIPTGEHTVEDLMNYNPVSNSYFNIAPVTGITNQIDINEKYKASLICKAQISLLERLHNNRLL